MPEEISSGLTPKYPWYEDEARALATRGLTRHPMSTFVSRFLSTFLAQWLIYDYRTGGVASA